MNNEVNCDKCAADFKIKLRKKTVAGGIEVTYFTCPKCFHKYTVSVFDAECRKLQREIREFAKEYQDAGRQLAQHRITDEEYQSVIDSLEDRRREKMARLEARHTQLLNETV